MTDYLNSQGLADSVIDSTLDVLAGQEDNAQELTQDGSVTLNPQVFSSDDPTSPRYLQATQGQRHIVLGPFTFDNKFDQPPAITFGQAANISADPSVPTIAQVATTYTPFLVMPYVFSWIFANGLVDGFMLGVYALTNPPSGVVAHTVSWLAIGKGSRYADQGLTESWESSYDQNEADFLTDDVEYSTTDDAGDVWEG